LTSLVVTAGDGTVAPNSTEASNSVGFPSYRSAVTQALATAVSARSLDANSSRRSDAQTIPILPPLRRVRSDPGLREGPPEASGTPALSSGFSPGEQVASPSFAPSPCPAEGHGLPVTEPTGGTPVHTGAAGPTQPLFAVAKQTGASRWQSSTPRTNNRGVLPLSGPAGLLATTSAPSERAGWASPPTPAGGARPFVGPPSTPSSGGSGRIAFPPTSTALPAGGADDLAASPERQPACPGFQQAAARPPRYSLRGAATSSPEGRATRPHALSLSGAMHPWTGGSGPLAGTPSGSPVSPEGVRLPSSGLWSPHLAGAAAGQAATGSAHELRLQRLRGPHSSPGCSDAAPAVGSDSSGGTRPSPAAPSPALALGSRNSVSSTAAVLADLPVSRLHAALAASATPPPGTPLPVVRAYPASPLRDAGAFGSVHYSGGSLEMSASADAAGARAGMRVVPLVSAAPSSPATSATALHWASPSNRIARDLRGPASSPPAAFTPSSSSPGSSPVNAWAGHRALVVDDSEMNRALLSRVLRSLGFVCETAENGAVALAMVSAPHAGAGASSPPLFQPFSLITLDRNMPALGGEDTARALRAGPRPFTGLILGITGEADAPMLQRFAAAGADTVLVKPVSKARIAEALAAHGLHT